MSDNNYFGGPAPEETQAQGQNAPSKGNQSQQGQPPMQGQQPMQGQPAQNQAQNGYQPQGTGYTPYQA